jgi:hypothetical protein
VITAISPRFKPNRAAMKDYVAKLNVNFSFAKVSEDAFFSQFTPMEIEM